MANPVVHFEVRAQDPDAVRNFFGELFGWTFPTGEEPGYTYVSTGDKGGITGGIGAAHGSGMVTFFVGVDDVEASLAAAERLGGKTVVPATSLPGITYGLFSDPEGHVIGVSKRG